MYVKWKLVSVRLEMVLVSAQDRCTVRAKRTIGLEIILCTRWYSKVTWVKSKLVSVRLEIVLILAQDTCPVCAEYTMGMKTILGTPNGTHG
jgi:hypothetical protein